VVTFTGGGFFVSNTFAGKVDFTTGASPYGVFTTDFDGDGKTDLAVPNLSSNNVSVLRNTGSAGNVSFAARSDYATGTQPSSSVMADLDGDGAKDLVVVNNASNSCSVFRNTSTAGTLAFVHIQTFSCGVNPRGVALRDLNDDGKADLVITNSGTNTFSVFLNTSSGVGVISLATNVDYSPGAQPTGIDIADIDGDGKPDVVIANYSAASVSVLRNTTSSGTLSFAAKVDLTTGSNPNSVVLADFDKDGKTDIATANYGSNSMSVLQNTSVAGSISFASKVDYSSGSNPFKISAADLNGDGWVDLIVSNVFDANVSVFRNSSGTFAAAVNYAVGSQPRGLVIADVDSDGKPDISTGNYNDNTVSVLRSMISGVVPVNLLQFSSKVQFSSVMLLWETTNQLNTSKFIVERSMDAISFIPLTTITAVNGSITQRYSTLDNSPANGNNYYRLKMVDINGSFMYSPVINVYFANSPLISVFPNPAVAHITVHHPVSSSESRLRIVDMEGRLVKTFQVEKNVTSTKINVKGIAAGAYTISWINNKNRINISLIIK
jgi:6-phosphogluconolactonase (cycloisomerase 2 family)